MWLTTSDLEIVFSVSITKGNNELQGNNNKKKIMSNNNDVDGLYTM